MRKSIEIEESTLERLNKLRNQKETDDQLFNRLLSQIEGKGQQGKSEITGDEFMLLFGELSNQGQNDVLEGDLIHGLEERYNLGIIAAKSIIDKVKSQAAIYERKPGVYRLT